MKKLLFAIVLTSITMVGIAHAQSYDKYIGEIFTFAGPYCPEGSLETKGQTIQISGDYTKLFSVIGTTYGGDGQNNFALPKIPPITSGEGTNKVELKTCIAFYGTYPNYPQR